ITNNSQSPKPAFVRKWHLTMIPKNMNLMTHHLRNARPFRVLQNYILQFSWDESSFDNIVGKYTLTRKPLTPSPSFLEVKDIGIDVEYCCCCLVPLL
ncbi:9373_t:CDS:2, partial [Racocetra persica]